MYNHRRMIDFDRAYPLRSKRIQNPERYEEEEVLESKLTAEVELIARSSYRLGIAEGNLNAIHGEAMKISEEKDSIEKELSSVTSDRDIYKRRADNYQQERNDLETELEKANTKIEKLKPKKKVVKNAGRTRKSNK